MTETNMNTSNPSYDGPSKPGTVGLPDDDLGEIPVAVVVASGLTEAEVLAAIAPKLARYKRPRAVCFVDELPRNTMSKVQKNALRAAYL